MDFVQKFVPISLLGDEVTQLEYQCASPRRMHDTKKKNTNPISIFNVAKLKLNNLSLRAAIREWNALLLCQDNEWQTNQKDDYYFLMHQHVSSVPKMVITECE